MKFTKMHGAGNDFIVIAAEDWPTAPRPEWIRRLSDRRFGVGCDQLLIVDRHERGASLNILNADGSAAEQCGNGLRCVARYAQRRWPELGSRFSIVGAAGEYAVQLAEERVSVNLSTPRVGSAITSLADCLGNITPVDMGNPHAVLRHDDIDGADLGASAATVAGLHDNFPNGVNVELVQRLDDNTVRVRVQERGAGETLACGSGACAVAAAGIKEGWLRSPVNVLMRGGRLVVTWPSDQDTIELSGSAEFVFEGDTLAGTQPTGTQQEAGISS